MTNAANAVPPGVPMTELVREARRCDLPTFVSRQGEGFLLYAGHREQMRRASREWQLTEPSRGRRTGQDMADDIARVIVYPFPDSTLEPWTVTVGRVSENEVVLDDESVSTYHAVFQRGAGGTFLLRDAGSAGGTFVNEVPLGGQPLPVRTGDLIRFGAVVLTFMLPADVYHFAQMLDAASREPEMPGQRGDERRAQLRSRELFSELGPGSTGAHPLSPTVPMIIEAVEQLELGHYDRARAMLADVLACEPDSRSGRIWLAVAEARQHVAAGELEQAARCYRAALALDGQHREARRELGVLKVRLDRRRPGRR